MAEARLKGKLTLDDSQFSAVLRRQTANAAKFAGTVTRTVGMAGAVGFAATTAAAIAASAALASATKKALDLGGKFSDLRAMTGASVKSLTLLSQAFDDAGIGGDNVGAIINKMQKAIESGSDAFERMGINIEALKRMSPDQQFMKIGQSIIALKTPAQQTQAAMDIFGKSGGKLLTFFKDSTALENARKVLGSMPEILDKNAEKFDAMSDAIGNITKKWDAFGIGFADKVKHVLEPILDKLLNIDSANIGKALGNDIAEGINGKTAQQAILDLASNFVAAFTNATAGIGKILTGALLGAFASPLARFQAGIEYGIGNVLRTIGVDKSEDINMLDERIRQAKETRDGPGRWFAGGDLNLLGRHKQRQIDELEARKAEALKGGNTSESEEEIYQRLMKNGGPKFGLGEGKTAQEFTNLGIEDLIKTPKTAFPSTTKAVTEEVKKAASEPIGPPPPRSTSGVGAFRDLQNSQSSWEKLQEATGFIRTMTPGSAMSQPVSLYSQPNAKGPDGVRRTVVGNQERSKKILGAEATKRKKDAESAEKAQMTTAEGVNKIVGLLGGKG